MFRFTISNNNPIDPTFIDQLWTSLQPKRKDANDTRDPDLMDLDANNVDATQWTWKLVFVVPDEDNLFKKQSFRKSKPKPDIVQFIWKLNKEHMWGSLRSSLG